MKSRKSIFLFQIITISLLLLAGCSSHAQTTQEESSVEQKADSNLSVSSEAQEESIDEPEDNTNIIPVSEDNEVENDFEEEKSSDSGNEVIENNKERKLFSELPSEFVFSSGAGAWGTGIDILEDGSFVGQYQDSDMGDIGDGYPNGTAYICNFSGEFSNPEPTDNQYIYSMKLLDLKINDDKEISTKEIKDGIRYVYSSPYGFDDADDFLIYLPGASLSDMTEECRSWIFLSDSIFKEVPDGYFVIYNVGGQEAFTAQSDDSIWYRSCIYKNGDAYVSFNPSYYMGSYLNFFTEENSPAVLGLSVPWDGKSTEPMECKESWNDDGTRCKVTIEPAAGNTPEMLKYAITVECISDPLFDFSAWGSSEPGKISAVFIEKKDKQDW